MGNLEKGMQTNLRPRNPIRGTIPASEIEAAYRAAFNISTPGFWERLVRAITGQSWQSPFYLADAYYQATNEPLIKLILENDETNLQHYIPEKFDCDDFAFRLMGVFHHDLDTAAMPIFITWVLTPEGGHAVLSYVTNNGAVMIIEPQTDQIFPAPSEWTLLLLVG